MSDKEKREKYDKLGKEGLGEMGDVDPTMLFEQLFGGGAFEHIFGKVEFMAFAAENNLNEEGLFLDHPHHGHSKKIICKIIEIKKRKYWCGSVFFFGLFKYIRTNTTEFKDLPEEEREVKVAEHAAKMDQVSR